MMKNILILFLGLTSVLFLAGDKAYAEPSEQGPVIVELFTSQGCHSCPPADKVLNGLADHPDIIALGFHVTYWDYLSWKDTLGHSFSDARQRLYARALRARNVYTPQMIVGGTEQFVGSHKRKTINAIKKAERPKLIPARRTEDNTLSINLPNVGMGQYTIWLAGVKDSHNENITRGENRGKTILYKNAVLEHRSLSQWNGKAETKSFELPNNPDIDRYVIFVQSDGYKDIVASSNYLP